MAKSSAKTRALIVVLGDQLTPALSSLAQGDPAHDVVLMAEVMDEATYVLHHKKKIAFIFSAMRHFASELRAGGWRVEYVRLDDAANGGSFTSEIARFAEKLKPQRIVITEPSEWRVAQMIESWRTLLPVPVDVLRDDRFVCSIRDFAAWAKDRKGLRMEYFYREMRKKTGLLMRDGEPEGGQWNYDAENRKAAKPDLFIPQPKHFKPDTITAEVLALVEARFGNHFGDLKPFWFATTRSGATAAFDHFVKTALPNFGDFQDAMLTTEKFLYHAIVSLYLNVGLLDPLAVCQRVADEYAAGRVPLNAAEGFIRQIIGWREYVRGIYWLRMPGYEHENFFGNTRPLPDFYWTAQTDMACLKACVTQTKEEAYAHHIQRLMVTGNFALIAGIDPHQVHAWYLAVYADAYEWVELPNTLGMSQFADGGLLGSKPYAASGNYINKMSDYCKGCSYDVKQRTGPKACPFNALYWDFIDRNEAKLGKNPRMGTVYATWRKMSDTDRKAVKQSSAAFLKSLKPYAASD
jgi:deoxyribodipyrimidine photolyase-related protein